MTRRVSSPVRRGAGGNGLRKQHRACGLPNFVVAWNGTKAGAERLKADIGHFLKDTLGLDLSDEKPRITHITAGYDFLVSRREFFRLLNQAMP